MNICVDVIANFNAVGDMKPIYVRLEDENHELFTYRIIAINQEKEENYSGINAKLFRCSILVGESLREITLRYHFKSHKWTWIQQTNF